VDIRDIAHSLANQCRFNGHCSHFYSVAEHSIEVSIHVPATDALWGLLHDAAEAYVSDIVRPLKGQLAFLRGTGAIDTFRVIETGILRTIAGAFDLPWPMPTCVDGVDLAMLATERLQLFDDRQPAWGDLDGVEPYSVLLACSQPHIAERRFLARFAELRAANG
jgi:hypothetical protein